MLNFHKPLILEGKSKIANGGLVKGIGKPLRFDGGRL
jgi:hypothetical protein